MALGLATYLVDSAKTDGISPVSDVACQEFRHISIPTKCAENSTNYNQSSTEIP